MAALLKDCSMACINNTHIKPQEGRSLYNSHHGVISRASLCCSTVTEWICWFCCLPLQLHLLLPQFLTCHHTSHTQSKRLHICWHLVAAAAACPSPAAAHLSPAVAALPGY